MLISLKQLIQNPATKSQGVFIFPGANPTVSLCNRRGKVVSSYKQLDEVFLTQEEKEFAENKWKNIKEKNPKFYDGYVTAIVDVLYDEVDNSVSFLMDRTRYSVSSAIYHPDYPNKERSKDFLSFGIGLMSNLSITPDGSLVMHERSQAVHNEKGAYSVPGGAMEYKEDEHGNVVKDDVARGPEEGAFGEVVEEMLSKKHDAIEKFAVGFRSLHYVKNGEKVGMNAFFEVKPKGVITRTEVEESFKEAEDGKYESTGKFFYVDTEKNISYCGENRLYQAPSDMINSGKLQGSGTAALASSVYTKMLDSYQKGLFAGLPPHPQSIADQFINQPGFDIFNIVALCKSKMDRALPGITPEKRKELEEHYEKLSPVGRCK